MKSILIEEELHERLKTHTKNHNLLLGKYVEHCITTILNNDIARYRDYEEYAKYQPNNYQNRNTDGK
jgi:hypothetical protein